MTASSNPQKQADYHETPYADSAWELIDELDEDPQFVPLQIDILSSDETQSDPMFADYGGHFRSEQKIFAHSTPGIIEKEESIESQLREELESFKASTEALIAAARNEALEQGKIQGREEALQEQVAEQTKKSESVEIVLKDLIQQLQRTVREFEGHAVQFSLDVAKKLIGQAVEINPEYIVEIVREALSKAGTALVERVRVSPEDYEFIELFGVRKILEDSDESWNFESDDTIRSGCVVDTSAGEIDYQLEEAWQRIADQVVKVVK
jgi:flagellar assembly protein FliH